MKRVFRVAIVLIPVTVLLIGVGLWRHHHLKTMNAEPKYVYKTVSKTAPIEPNASPTNATASNITPETSEYKDEIISPEKTDNTDNPFGDATLNEIAEQPRLSPEAATALKEYEAAHSEYLATQGVLKAALDARPIDWERIRSANDNIEKAAQSRMDALEKLALYLDEAFEEFIATIDQQNETDRTIADRIAERRQEFSPEAISILETFETISPEERKRIVEAIPQLKEMMKNMYGYEIPE